MTTSAPSGPPDPRDVRTLAELTDRLRALRAWSGMSYRELHRQIARARLVRGTVEVPSLDTVHRCLRPGRVRLDGDLLVDVVMALLGTGSEAEAASWRAAHQAVTGQATSAAAAVLVGLPPDRADFVGRRGELARLTGHGAAGFAAVVAGMPGVGKTALAVHAAHLLAPRFADLQLTVYLGGHDPRRPPADPASVLDALLRRLGAPTRDLRGPDLRRRMHRYRDLVARRRMLILLDDAASEDQVRPLIPDSPDCAVLVTSRRRQAGLPTVALDVLPAGESIALLRRASGDARIDADPVHAARIADLTGHLPLALTLVAGRIKANPDWTLADHVERLTDHHSHLRLDEPVEVEIAKSYAVLPGPAARVLRLLSLHPADDFDLHAAAALAGHGWADVDGILADLVAANLVEQRHHGRYGLHDLVRILVQRRAIDQQRPSDRRAAIGRLLDHYRLNTLAAMRQLMPHEARFWPDLPTAPVPGLVVTDLGAAADWLDAECVSVITTAVHGASRGWPAHASDLSSILSRHLLLTGQHHEALRLHGAASQVSDGRELGRTLTSLAGAHGRTGRLAESLDCCLRAIAVFRGVGDRAGETDALINLGAVTWRLGEYPAALDAFQQVVMAARETGDRLAEFYGRGGIGCVWWRLGRYPAAIAEHQRSLSIARALGERAGEGEALQRIGWMHRHLFQLAPAEDHLARALAIATDTGDQVSTADALYQLGAVHREAGRIDHAIDHQYRALAIAETIDDPTLQVDILVELAHTERRAAHLDTALRHGRTALTIATRVGTPQPLADAHDALARCHRHLGDASSAARHWQQALTIYTGLGVPDAERVTAALEALDRTGSGEQERRAAGRGAPVRP